jgi:restriction endonuclease S subunit
LGNVLKINQALQGAAQNAGQSALMEKLMEELALITPVVKEQDEA